MGNHKITEIHQYDDPLIHFNLFSYCDFVTFVARERRRWRKHPLSNSCLK
jgi:hypothetical protein